MRIRDIDEYDIERVIEIYRAAYGDDFPFQEFYDARWIKKGVFDEDIAWVVAEDDDGRVIGSAAVLLNAGDADDLIGEFGRLVVDPDSRTHGVATAMMAELTQRVSSWIEWGFGECRTVHPAAQKICDRLGFGVIGFEPLAYRIGERRESMALMARLFGNAARLRRNNPRVIPSVYPIGYQALHNVGLEPDLIIAADAPPYPWDNDIAVDELAPEEAYRLLRIGRGRNWEREIHGGVRLEHGYLRLAAHSAQYLVAHMGEAPVGAVGYAHDPIDDKVIVTELIAADPVARGTLLRAFVDHVTERHRPVCIYADVSAHAPCMQATLEQLGFCPVGFCPAMVFEGVERLDVVRMVRLSVPWGVGPVELIEPAAAMRDLVEREFAELSRGQVMADIARGIAMFAGLNEVEIARIRRICHERSFEPGEIVFAHGDPGEDLYVLLSGEVAVVASVDEGRTLGVVGPGEAFGEMGLIDGRPRSAAVVCRERSTMLVIARAAFHDLMDERPAIGRRVMHNLAAMLSGRLRAADHCLEWGG